MILQGGVVFWTWAVFQNARYLVKWILSLHWHFSRLRGTTSIQVFCKARRTKVSVKVVWKCFLNKKTHVCPQKLTSNLKVMETSFSRGPFLGFMSVFPGVYICFLKKLAEGSFLTGLPNVTLQHQQKTESPGSPLQTKSALGKTHTHTKQQNTYLQRNETCF